MSEQSGTGSKRDMTPTPREHELPNGDLVSVCTRTSPFRPIRPKDAVIVPSEKRPLYELLLDVLDDVSLPDLFPARVACECENLVDARDTLGDLERGGVGIHGVWYGMSYTLRAKDAIVSYRDREPLRLVGVGCSGSKYDVDEPTPAADLYQGAYWSCKNDYSATIGDDRRIISAQHAVLNPAEKIEYYERTPEDLEGVPVDSDKRLPNGDDVDTLLDQWAVDVYEGLTRWIRDAAAGIDPRDVELEVLLGTKYRDPLEERSVFEELRAPASLEASFPFQEVEQAKGGNGNQMGWMTDEVAATRAVATDGGQNV